MSFNYTEDTSPTLADWESILNAFNCNITEDEVWEVARQYNDVPHFSYDINAISTHFYIEGDFICSKSDFLNKVDSIKTMYH